MKTVGIIGGLGPQATMDIVARIHKVSQAQIPQFVNRGYPPLWVVYFRDSPLLEEEDGTVIEPLQPAPALLQVAADLGKHVDLLAMASNTPHFFAREIEEAAGRPLVSMVDAVVEEVRRRALKKVGILAIEETTKHGLYQRPLEEMGIACEVIPDELMEELDEKAIYPVMEGKDPGSVNEPAVRALTFLREKGVEGVILGCTEVPLLLAHEEWSEEWSSDIINPSQLLAEAIVAAAKD